LQGISDEDRTAASVMVERKGVKDSSASNNNNEALANRQGLHIFASESKAEQPI
jgi:hypothetical protein